MTHNLRRLKLLPGLSLLLIVLASVAGSVLVGGRLVAHGAGNYSTSWVGTSSTMSGANNQWVQDFVNSAIVRKTDGAIFTMSNWDEAHHEFGDYKDGKVLDDGNLFTNNHNLNNNSARSITDTQGHTWTINNPGFLGGNKVCRNDNNSICITGDSNFRPNAVAMANDGTLIVGDNGIDQQLKLFDVSTDTPRLVKTIGEKGGAWAGPNPGLTGPLRFNGIWGVGQDVAGNYYIIGNFPGGGTWMRSIKENGTLNWQLYGKIWVSNSVPDMTTNGQDVYDHNSLYKMDYSQTTTGKEVIGDFPTAVTIDPWHYPTDSRLQTSDDNNTYPLDKDASVNAHYAFTFYVPKWIRSCYGHKFMYTTSMFGGQAGIYEQNGNFWVEKAFSNLPSNTSWNWAQYFDTNCDLWLATDDGKVSYYPATGVNSSGNLTYGAVVNYPQLTDFNDVLRMQYDRQSDTLYVSGFTNARPRVYGWGEAGSEFITYSHWKSGRQVASHIDLPYKIAGDVKNQDTQDSTLLKDWDIVGGYLFTGFVAKNDQTNEQDTPAIFSLKDGSRIDLATQSPIVFNDVGWMDVKGISVGQRANGEYLVFMEDDWKNKSLLYRWCPSNNCSEAGSSAKPTATTSSKSKATPTATPVKGKR